MYASTVGLLFLYVAREQVEVPDFGMLIRFRGVLCWEGRFLSRILWEPTLVQLADYSRSHTGSWQNSVPASFDKVELTSSLVRVCKPRFKPMFFFGNFEFIFAITDPKFVKWSQNCTLEQPRVFFVFFKCTPGKVDEGGQSTPGFFPSLAFTHVEYVMWSECHL